MTPDEREQAIRVLQNAIWPFLAHDPDKPDVFWSSMLDAIAPLLVEARRSGLEQGFDECWIEYVAAAGDQPATNPYRSPQPEVSRG